MISFRSTYAALPDRFFRPLQATQFPDPKILIWNDDVAKNLGITITDDNEDFLTDLFSGRKTLPGQRLLAQAYSGHQFGHFNPQLGDGRACLLGELLDQEGVLQDVHLKGSGRTPFSRSGDGRATLSACLREYLVSEGMHGLGVPTSRILAVISTGEQIDREEGRQPGAICVRVAKSHVRIGTFEHFASRGDLEALRILAEFTIDRHFPHLKLTQDPLTGLLREVILLQTRLVAQWMGVGFVHGVMNTDNTFVSGQTLDYGPCAFLEQYDPDAVFSRIDRHGRYAYGRQPEILKWNLENFALCLSQIGDPAAMEAEMARFTEQFEKHFLTVFGKKLGIEGPKSSDRERINAFLEKIRVSGEDFTLAFARFPGNPQIIPRNHRVEDCLRAALEGNLEPTRSLASALRNPFEYLFVPGASASGVDLSRPALPHEEVRSTHCNT